MQVNSDTDKETGLKKQTSKPPLKQTCIVVTIMVMSFLSVASDAGNDTNYIDIFVAAVLFCLMVILTEYKGRKLLFITLSCLSIMSSTALLTVQLPGLGDLLQMAIRGATVALTGVVLCEYVEPRHRLPYLMVNSAVLRVSYWPIPGLSDFDSYFHFVKIALGLICLGSVLTWPESPYWLASKRRFEEAKKSFLLVRSGDPKSTELKTLIEAHQQSGLVKMIYVPLLLGFPIVLVYTTIIYDFENAFYSGSTNMNLDETWIYLAVNVFITGVSVLIARKLTRRVLILLPTATWTISVIAIIIWENVLKDSASKSVYLFITDFSFQLLYPLALCAITLFNYPIAIESISCKYSNLLSGILGVIYFISLTLFEYIELLDVRVVLACIIVCLLLNPIIAYFLLPEAKDKSLIEIEQAYRPKLEQRGQTECNV